VDFPVPSPPHLAGAVSHRAPAVRRGWGVQDHDIVGREAGELMKFVNHECHHVVGSGGVRRFERPRGEGHDVAIFLDCADFQRGRPPRHRRRRRRRGVDGVVVAFRSPSSEEDHVHDRKRGEIYFSRQQFRG